MPTAAPGLLLVDLIPDTAVHHLRTITYPFLMGLGRLLGWRARWRVIGVRYAPDLRYTLTPEDLALLVAEARRLKPKAVVINQRLPKAQLSALAAAAGARVVYWDMTENVHDLAEVARRRVPAAPGKRRDDRYCFRPVDSNYGDRAPAGRRCRCHDRVAPRAAAHDSAGASADAAACRGAITTRL